MKELTFNNNQKSDLLSLKQRPFSSVGMLSTLSSQNQNENISNINSNSTLVNQTDIYKRKLIGKSKKKILVTIKEEATINKKTDQLQPEDKFCKICFDTNESNSQGKLISPCRCQGSVRYIHDECLKTWLVSQRKDIQNASCEICHTKYKMAFKYGSKFYPRQALEDGLLSLVSSICLLLLVITLIVIIIVFALRWNSKDTEVINEDSNQQNESTSTTYRLAILISCSVICLILIILFIVAVKEAFFVLQIKHWIISNFIVNEKKTIKKLDTKDINKIQVLKMKTPFFKRSFSDQIFPIKGKNIIVPKKQLDFKIIKIISKNNQILNKNNETKSLDSFFNFFKYKKNENNNFMTKCETDKILSINNFLFEEKLKKLKNKGKKIDVLRFSGNSSKNDIKEIFADQINENFKTEKNDKVFDVIVFDNYEENKASEYDKKDDTKLVKFYKKSVEFSNFEEK